MDYTQFPNFAQQKIPDQSPKVTGNSLSGSGILSAGTVLALGGSNGVTISGVQGIYAGGQNPASSPFSVDLQGNLRASSAVITGNITSGSTITGAIINGGTLQTAQSGQRVIISASTLGGFAGNSINFAVDNTVVGTLYGNASSILLTDNPSGAGDFFHLNPTGGGAEVTGSLYATVSAGTAVVTLSGNNTAVTGNFTVSGTKAFDTEHPTKDGMRLQYIAVESPEVLVLCRGTGVFKKEQIPDHFTAISEPNTLQVIQGIDPLTGGVNWVATAVRLGYNEHQPEYIANNSVS
jgi:hypothetical protein